MSLFREREREQTVSLSLAPGLEWERVLGTRLAYTYLASLRQSKSTTKQNNKMPWKLLTHGSELQ